MKSVNIKDIAKAAGVGVSTVSRVLNNQPDVKSSTKEKVLKVIEELNYVPNNSARNLKRNKTNNIGIFIVGEYSNFFSRIVEAIDRRLSAKSYTLVLHFHKGDREILSTAIQFSLEKKLIGMIVLGGTLLNTDIGYLKQLDIPVVFGSTVLSTNVDRHLYSSVTINNFESTVVGIQALIDHGHKNIGIIAVNEAPNNVGNKRHDAYQHVLNRNHIPYNNQLVAIGDYSIKSGYEAMKTLLTKGVTAIFAVSDLMAIGACKAILESGLSIPQDISVLGFDGLEIGRYMHPSLSTIEQPYKQMGDRVAEIIVASIEEKAAAIHEVLETTFYKGQTIKLMR